MTVVQQGDTSFSTKQLTERTSYYLGLDVPFPIPRSILIFDFLRGTHLNLQTN